MSVEANYTNRRTRDILEDYDLALLRLSTNGTTDYPGPINDPQSLWLASTTSATRRIPDRTSSSRR